MNNPKGSVLVVALSMVFLFAALGIGALEYGGAQKQSAFSQEASARAFWLADAGLQSYCQANAPAPSQPFYLGAGSYNVTSTQNGGNDYLSSTGTLNTSPITNRTVQADCTITSPFENAMTTFGTINLLGTTINGNLSSTAADYTNAAGYNTNYSVDVEHRSIVNGNVSTVAGGTPNFYQATLNGQEIHNFDNPTSGGHPIVLPADPTNFTCPYGGIVTPKNPQSLTWNQGVYACARLEIDDGATLTFTGVCSGSLTTNCTTIYLTNNDQDGLSNGEDLYGGADPGSPVGGTILVDKGGLTIYAAGRMTFGSNVVTSNTAIPTTNTITINWASDGAASYSVEYGTISSSGVYSSPTYINLGNSVCAGNSCTYSLTPVTNGTTYYYEVTDGLSADSVLANYIFSPTPSNINVNVLSNITVNNTVTGVPNNFIIYSSEVTPYSIGSSSYIGFGPVPDSAAVDVNNGAVPYFGLIDAPQGFVFINGNGVNGTGSFSGSIAGSSSAAQSAVVNQYQSASAITGLNATYVLSAWQECPTPNPTYVSGALTGNAC